MTTPTAPTVHRPPPAGVTAAEVAADAATVAWAVADVEASSRRVVAAWAFLRDARLLAHQGAYPHPDAVGLVEVTDAALRAAGNRLIAAREGARAQEARAADYARNADVGALYAHVTDAAVAAAEAARLVRDLDRTLHTR